ncbi:MAG: extracellular solute-binding protein [Alphaproteobacteria bacterium]|nr:extracellular solute-binding protein [Alphaproteobacteria bacterium]
MTFMKYLTSATAVALVAGAAAVPAHAENITYFTFESLADDPLLALYVEKYGEKPNVKIFADEDEAFTSMLAGYKPDLMGPCSYEFERWREAGLLQPIDVTKLAFWDKIAPSLKNIPGAMKSETEAWFVPQYWASTSVTFRTDLAPEYVDKPSWGILWDPKYKGRVSAIEGVDDTVTLTAKHMGLDPYNLSPEQWEQVQVKLRELVANSRVVSSDQTTIAQGLASGELVAAITWSDSYGTLKSENVPVGFMQPPGGVFNYVCGYVVHKEATEWERLYTLMDAGLTNEAALHLVENYSNGSANVEAMAAIPQETLDAAGLIADVDAYLATGTFQVRMPNKDEVVKSWTEIRAGL